MRALFVSATESQGVLPRLLSDLQACRKDSKVAMEATKDPRDKAVLNAKQMAYKVSMNAVYGFCGVNEDAGILPCLEVARTVTFVGRSMILHAKRLIEGAFRGCRVVYGDTDSLMIDFAVETVEEATRLGEQAAQLVTRAFPAPIRFCFEKCYQPFLLFSKKRYAGVIRSPGSTTHKVDCKGVQFVRRDTCAFVKRTCQTLMDALLTHMDVEGAKRVVRDAVRTLLLADGEQKVVAQDLVVTKTVKNSGHDLLCHAERKCARCLASLDDTNNNACDKCGRENGIAYKNAASLPAVQVAIREERANPGQGPRAGDAVDFVFVVSSSSKNNGKLLCSDRAEHPRTVAQNNLRPDVRLYYDQHLKNPVTEAFSLVLGSSPAQVEALLFGDIVHEYERRLQGQRDIRHALFGMP